MNLHFDNEAFRELIELSADYFGYEQSHVEKDYWITKILKEIASSEFAGLCHFKGGTSLSKAYGIISRFSEDLDVFVYSGNASSSKQAEKTLNRKLSHLVIENNKDMYREELSKTGGDFRKLAFSYDTHYQGIGLKENLEVEIKCCTLDDKTRMYYPAQRRTIAPIITDYLKQNSAGATIISQFGLEEFEVLTIDPKRTLCDKISRLTRLSYNEDYETLIAKHIRDVYDISMLLELPEYKEFVRSEEFVIALQMVTEEDGLFTKVAPHRNLSEARIFRDAEQTLQLPAVYQAYSNELRKLMFDASHQPPVEHVVSQIALLYEPLRLFDKAIQ
jgi:predicted nucleotidyltransferase component of viral defense system